MSALDPKQTWLAIPLALALIFSMARAQEADGPPEPEPKPTEPAGPKKPDTAKPPAQPPGDPDGKAKPPGPETPKLDSPEKHPNDGLRDPTETPAALRRLSDGSPASLPPETTTLPKIELKARVLASGKQPAALISIGGEIYLVRKDSEVTLNSGPIVVTTFRSDDLAATSVSRGSVATVGKSSIEIQRARYNDPNNRTIVLKVIELGAEGLVFEILTTRQTFYLR